MTDYTVTLTEAELALLREAAMRHLVNDETIAKLEAAKPIKPKAPRKAASTPVEPFAPNTGDARLDAFMRARHRPDWQARQRSAFRRTAPGMTPMPTPPKGWPLEPKDARRFSMLFG